MSLDTPANARVDLATLLASVTGATVLSYEPFGQAQGPYISLFCDGWDDLWWNFTVRIYVNLEPGDATAQDTLDTLTWAVYQALDTQWGGPIEWTIAYDDTLGALVAALPVHAGRQ